MRVHVPISIRWGDLDAYNHVNNVELMRLLEEARVRVFWRDNSEGGDVDSGMALIEAEVGSNTVTLVARHEVEYLLPIPYQRQPLDIQMWIGKLGGASLQVDYEVYGPVGGEQPLYARASSTIVLVDAATSRPRRITDEERAAWTRYLEAPVQFTKRG